MFIFYILNILFQTNFSFNISGIILYITSFIISILCLRFIFYMFHLIFILYLACQLLHFIECILHSIFYVYV